MKKLILYFSLLFSLVSCGTTGHIVFYNFNATKYDVENALLNVINADSNYITPIKWKEHTEGDYFERIYIYFKGSPEELYQLGFNYDSTIWRESATSRLAFISIYQGDQFQYESDLSAKEIKRVEKRFETEILQKLKITYYKAD